MNNADGFQQLLSHHQNNTNYPELPINIIKMDETIARMNARNISMPVQNLIIDQKYKFRTGVNGELPVFGNFNENNILSYRGIRSVPIVTPWGDHGWAIYYVFQDIFGRWYGMDRGNVDHGGFFSLKKFVSLKDYETQFKHIGKEHIFKRRVNKAIHSKKTNEEPGSFLHHAYNPDLPNMRNIIQEKEASGSYIHPDLIGNWELDESGSRKKKKFEFGKKVLLKDIKTLKKIILKKI